MWRITPATLRNNEITHTYIPSPSSSNREGMLLWVIWPLEISLVTAKPQYCQDGTIMMTALRRQPTKHEFYWFRVIPHPPHHHPHCPETKTIQTSTSVHCTRNLDPVCGLECKASYQHYTRFVYGTMQVFACPLPTQSVKALVGWHVLLL